MTRSIFFRRFLILVCNFMTDFDSALKNHGLSKLGGDWRSKSFSPEKKRSQPLILRVIRATIIFFVWWSGWFLWGFVQIPLRHTCWATTCWTGWWFQIFFIFIYSGKGSNLTNIFQMGWNHQLVIDSAWQMFTSFTIWQTKYCDVHLSQAWTTVIQPHQLDEVFTPAYVTYIRGLNYTVIWGDYFINHYPPGN